MLQTVIWKEDYFGADCITESLDKTKVTGIEQVDTVQDSVNNAVGQQVGKGGVLQPVGE